MPSRAPIQNPYLSLKPMARKPLGRQGTWALMTANTTNWEGAERLIRALGRPGHPSKPTFIVIQEHRKADTQACKQAEDWASEYGYNLSLAPAAHTGTGKLQTSGGVAVGVQKHIGITIDLPFQQEFAAYQGRIHAVICNCLFKRGVLVVGAYWRSGLDHAMLNQLSTYLLSCGRPWMLAGDWNAHPTELTKTGFLGKTGGKLIAQPLNTCTMGKGSNIDYAVLCPRMATKYYSNSLWTAGPVAPHHPLFINFTSAPEDAVYLHRDKPKAFPHNPPIGCERAPRQFTWARPVDAPVPDISEAWKE